MGTVEKVTVRMSRGDSKTSWGFRVQGGTEFGSPLLIGMVNQGSLADRAGLREGDHVIQIAHRDAGNIRHKDAQDAIVASGNDLDLIVQRHSAGGVGGGVRIWQPDRHFDQNANDVKYSLKHHETSRKEISHAGSGHNVAPAPFSSGGPPSAQQHSPQQQYVAPAPVSRQMTGGTEKVVHLQYNSPAPLYSSGSKADAYLQQTGGLFGSESTESTKFNPEPNDPKAQAGPKYLQSETLRYLRETEERGGGGGPGFGERSYDGTLRHAQSDVQSDSFRRLTTSLQSEGGYDLPSDRRGQAPPGAPQCDGCGRGIMGVFCKAGERQYHAECYKCATCGTSLKNIGYTLIEGKIYCDVHAKQKQSLRFGGSMPVDPKAFAPAAAPFDVKRQTNDPVKASYQPEILKPASHHVHTQVVSPLDASSRGIPKQFNLGAGGSPRGYDSSSSYQHFSSHKTTTSTTGGGQHYSPSHAPPPAFAPAPAAPAPSFAPAPFSQAPVGPPASAPRGGETQKVPWRKVKAQWPPLGLKGSAPAYRSWQVQPQSSAEFGFGRDPDLPEEDNKLKMSFETPEKETESYFVIPDEICGPDKDVIRYPAFHQHFEHELRPGNCYISSSLEVATGFADSSRNGEIVDTCPPAQFKSSMTTQTLAVSKSDEPNPVTVPVHSESMWKSVAPHSQMSTNHVRSIDHNEPISVQSHRRGFRHPKHLSAGYRRHVKESQTETESRIFSMSAPAPQIPKIPVQRPEPQRVFSPQPVRAAKIVPEWRPFSPQAERRAPANDQSVAATNLDFSTLRIRSLQLLEKAADQRTLTAPSDPIPTQSHSSGSAIPGAMSGFVDRDRLLRELAEAQELLQSTVRLLKKELEWKGGGGGGGPGGPGSAIAGSLLGRQVNRGAVGPRRGRGILQQLADLPRVPYCESCSREIRGPFVLALNKTWCPDHFVCNHPQCGRKLLDVGFVEEAGGRIYCEFCFEKYFAPHCAKCSRSVTGDCLNAMDKQWHPECFTCMTCHKPFGNEPFYVEGGQPYCDADWNIQFTAKCISCEFPIEAGDRWVEALGGSYHSNCFTCSVCHTQLEGQSFYAKGGRPYCKTHA